MENNWLERFRAEYKPLLKDKYDEFEYGLSCPKARHIRVQSSRNIDYLSELNNICTLEKLEEYNNVYKAVENADKIVESISFQTGGVYIMNPSSIAPVEILMSYMGENPVMLDVSSAPGGKTCALSDISNRKGIIVANEISASRLKSLHFNLEKYGAYNVKTVSMDGRLLPNIFENSFDGILLDAPCSNENKIFRNKTVQAEWNKKLVERMADLQRQLIKSAFLCLKEGGVLVYSTCTLSLEENEYVIKYLLDEFDNAELLPAGSHYGKGLSGISHIDENIASISEYDRRGYIETAPEIFKKVKFKRRGLNLYKDTGKMYEPSCQSVWQWGSFTEDNMRYIISADWAENFLKGFDISCNNNYNNELLFFNNIPVGYAKKVDNMLKNKLDRYFLYGKNIEW